MAKFSVLMTGFCLLFSGVVLATEDLGGGGSASQLSNREKFREYIIKGYIEIGMTTDEVVASWGRPKQIKYYKTGPYDEMWVYVPNWKFRNKLYFKSKLLVRTNPDYLVFSKMAGH